MKSIVKKMFVVLTLVLIVFALALPACAEPATDATASTTESVEAVSDAAVKGNKAIAAAITIAIAAGAGAIAMGMAIAKAVDGISRQPEADGKIRTSLMLGLVFIETAIIYALIVAILVIFVL